MVQSTISSWRAEGDLGSGFRIASDELSPRETVPTVNRELAQAPFGTQITPLGDGPLEGVVVERLLPNLNYMWARSTPVHALRAGPVHMRGSDSLVLGVATAPRASRQFGRDYSLLPGEGIAVGNAGPGGTAYLSACEQTTVIVSQESLRPFLKDKSAHFVRCISPDNGALQLLVGYLAVLKDTTVPPELEPAVVAHVHDLLAVALGANRDGIELARTRGVRAARLHAVKRDVMEHLDGQVSVDTLASRHRLTPRYVQMLFADEGVTFTEFVRNQRLASAHRMLSSPRFDHKRIGEIAFEVGFGDLAYFNRAFRQRYGLSPGDARAGKAAGQ